MAPCKQPKTLRGAAQENLVRLSLDACVQFEKTSHGYGSSQCATFVHEMQEYLGTLPEGLLIEVGQEILQVMPFLYKKRISLKNKGLLAYAVVMQTNLNKITLDMEPFSNETESYINELLRKMRKLREIHFKFACAPSFASIIAKSCSNLEKITLSSCENEQTLILTARTFSLFTRCSQLRYFDCGGVSLIWGDVMPHILESLPDMEIFVVPKNASLGDMLATITNNGPLKLRNFSENNATPAHIDSVIALCPFITDLKLQPVTVEALDGIMEKLTNCSLNIQTLELIFNFPHIHSCFESFLESKGSYLKSLEIVFINQWIPFDLVRSIGEFCPHLQRLKIQVKAINREFDLHENSTPIVVHSEGTGPFQNLSTLELLVEPCVFTETPVFNLRIVHYCLENAVRLKSLRLSSVLKPGITFDEFVQIFGKGRMQELKHLRLECCPNALTKKMLQFVYETFQQLTYMELDHRVSSNVKLRQYLRRLSHEAKRKNIDIVIKYAFFRHLYSPDSY